MQLFKNTLSINFINHTSKTGIISLLLFISAICILFFQGLNLTIEFRGGTNFNIVVPNTPINEFRSNIQETLQQNITIVKVGDNNLVSNFLLRMKFIEDETLVVQSLRTIYPDLEIKSINSFGPKLGEELQTSARNAILMALLLISIYIAIRFDRYYALGSVIALIHDVIITVGILSILNVEIGISIIAALLTIVGYSLNDTIVVYDRIRENINKFLDDNKQSIVNRALNETLNRTVITSFTTLAVMIILFFFGGDVLKPFSLTLIIGILIGTYSSLYVASPIMLYFEEKYPIPEFIDEEA
jgi:preprotein translocase subunit SecF